MSRSEAQAPSRSLFKAFAAFVAGIGIGLALVWPSLPADLDELTRVSIPQGGDVILVGVLALAILALLAWVFYRVYLTF